MQMRNPVVAGQFYPGERQGCIAEITACLAENTLKEPLPETIVAGIVPHAGWTFSGEVAAMVFAAIKKQNEKVHTFVIFGATHRHFGQTPVVYGKGFWETPLGTVTVNEELATWLLDEKLVISDSSAHAAEHSIEVQVPFIQHLFPEAEILPIVVPSNENAICLGESVGKIIGSADKKIICIGSTDLTHYGPRYGFTPMGTGPEAVRWAGEVNDKEFIDLALKLDAEALLKSAAENGNACGPGAAAAAVAAAKKLGKTEGVLLAQTNSNEIMLRKMGTSSQDSVGYAAIVF